MARFIGGILIACIALAVLKAAAAVLILAFIVAGVVALIARPKETIGFVVLMTLATNPALALFFGAIVIVVALIRR